MSKLKLKITSLLLFAAIIIGIFAYVTLQDIGKFTLVMIPLIIIVNVVRVVEMKRMENQSSH